MQEVLLASNLSYLPGYDSCWN